jgi:hypothetical protein
MTVRIKKPITKAKLEKADKLLKKKRSTKKKFNAKKFAGKLKGVFGDPVAYQKKLRDEWE